MSIESKEYEERKDHFIKGGFTIEDDYVRGRKILRCAKIDKEVTITINRPVAVNNEPLESLCELCGEPLTEEDGKMFRYHGYARECPKPPKKIEELENKVKHQNECSSSSGDNSNSRKEKLKN